MSINSVSKNPSEDDDGKEIIVSKIETMEIQTVLDAPGHCLKLDKTRGSQGFQVPIQSCDTHSDMISPFEAMGISEKSFWGITVSTKIKSGIRSITKSFWGTISKKSSKEWGTFSNKSSKEWGTTE